MAITPNWYFGETRSLLVFSSKWFCVPTRAEEVVLETISCGFESHQNHKCLSGEIG